MTLSRSFKKLVESRIKKDPEFKRLLEMELKIGDGVIEIDTDRARTFGFTSDKFWEHSHLWKKNHFIIISAIESKGKGNFRDLIEKILSLGYGVKIPTPLGRMKSIVEKNGYVKLIEHCEEMGPVEVWVLFPKDY